MCSNLPNDGSQYSRRRAPPNGSALSGANRDGRMVQLGEQKRSGSRPLQWRVSRLLGLRALPRARPVLRLLAGEQR
jgi:hypothetical protein